MKVSFDLSVILLLLPGAVAQDPIDLFPVQDTYVRGGIYADTNFGTVTRSSGAVVGNPDMPTKESSNADLIRRGYTQFNLTSLPSNIASATLRLHVRGNNRVNPLLNVSTVSDNSWDELTMTYDTSPTIGQLIASVPCPPKGEWMSVDLTSDVQSAVGSLWSLALTGGTYGASVGFATRDDTHGRSTFLEVTTGTGPAISAAPSSMPSSVPSSVPSSMPSSVPSFVPSSKPSFSSVTLVSLPLDDTFVRDSSPDKTGYGTYSSLTVSYGTSHDKRYTYVKLDIDLAQGSSFISEAKLDLYVKDLDSSGSMAINVYPVLTEAWNEASTSWNTQPGYDVSNPIHENLPIAAESSWMSINLTDFVSTAAAAFQPTVSIAILPVENGGPAGLKTKFSSKESGSQPQFTLAFIPYEGSLPPTSAPTTTPSGSPTNPPSSMPSSVPSSMPSSVPSFIPSNKPSFSPVTLVSLPLDDTFVRDSSPTNTGYGTYSSLTVSYGTSHDKRYTYVKLDIDLAQGSSFVSEAKLDLYVKDLDSSGSMNVNVYPVLSEAWNEASISWNSQPGATQQGGPGYDIFNPIHENLPIAAESSWMSIDLTDYVSTAAAAFQPTVSIAILPVENGGTAGLKTKFSSKESASQPQFTLTFIPYGGSLPPTAAPTTTPTRSPTNPPLSYPQLVSLDANDQLVYEPYANEINELLGSVANPAVVNTVPDFSNAGYKGGGVPIPFVAAAETVSPMSGDARWTIQAAIDAVSNLTPDANGFRGAVLIEAGDYDISEPGLSVVTSGVVIRGEGSGAGGTKLHFTSTNRDSFLVNFGKVSGGITPSGAAYSITDTFVPVGAKTFTVSDASSFSVGDSIVIEFQPNQLWIDHLSNMGQHGWTPGGYDVIWRRKIDDKVGNQITVTAPLVHALEQVYGSARIWKYTFADEITNVGIENIRLECTFANDSDENHGKSAVSMRRVRDGWVRQVTAKYFWYGVVTLTTRSSYITVEDTAMLEHKGQIRGGRRYSFNIDDSDFLYMQRCLASEGRHDFASGSRTSGPNVFVDSIAVNSTSDSGPHHRFATGQLYDNIKAAELRVRNRGNSGSGHGWAGVQVMFYNTESTYICDAPNGGMNWVIGNVGSKDDDIVPEPDGIIQSPGVHVTPRSLYYAQLKQRLQANALHSVVIPTQKSGPIWDELETWFGEGLFGDAVVPWFDEESGPIAQASPVSIGGYIRNLNLLGKSSISYSWTMTSGAGAVTFGDVTALETTVQFDTVGSYTLQLQVSGGTIVETGTLDITVV